MNTRQKIRFVWLDFYRFIFALIVVFSHYQGQLASKTAYLAVDFFFVLSGFVLAYAYADKVENENFAKNFLIDRVARLYPLYFLFMLITLVLNIICFALAGHGLSEGWAYKDGRAYTFILSLLLLQNAGLTTNASWIAPAWSISVEVIVNVALIYVFAKMYKARNDFNVITALGSVSLFFFVVIFNAHKSLGNFETNLFGFLNSGLARGFAGILLGIIVYKVYKLMYSLAQSKQTECFLVLWASGIVLAVIFLSGYKVNNIDFIAIPFFFIFILSMAWRESFAEKKSSRLDRVAEVCGSMSYGIYIVHWPLLEFTRYILWDALKIPIPVAKESLLMELGFAACVCVLARLLFVYFELPMKKCVKNALLKMQKPKSRLPSHAEEKPGLPRFLDI